MTRIWTTLIDANTLAELVDEPGLRVVDCRYQLDDPTAGRAAYLRGHVPGAVYADLGRDLSAPPAGGLGRHPLPTRQDFAATLAQLGIGNSHQVVAYDDVGGASAARLWWMLRWMGHGAVAVLDGGLPAWRAGGRVLEPGEVRAPATRFVPGEPLTHVVSTEDVLQGRAGRLLDARSPERYRGEVEPLDTVAGHIPGAINHPFTQSLDHGGRFVDPESLRAGFRESLAGANPEAAVAMCGSGVTACHLLLAMEHAGLTGGRLYAGSWSEWIRDPERPVAGGNAAAEAASTATV